LFKIKYAPGKGVTITDRSVRKLGFLYLALQAAFCSFFLFAFWFHSDNISKSLSSAGPYGASILSLFFYFFFVSICLLYGREDKKLRTKKPITRWLLLNFLYFSILVGSVIISYSYSSDASKISSLAFCLVASLTYYVATNYMATRVLRNAIEKVVKEQIKI
jgi:hypothetical protein